ncbi:TraB/GumN family protein [Cognatilysobacter tabacisoli]|uniref:TraB/GumN family protein n=1 Tax=Cognatilysobacter tabacisoli TaxID=2315424 RepID=UPI000E6B39CC|nr:TraB/GumN family protein [Lysobacter tabacisoli]
MQERKPHVRPVLMALFALMPVLVQAQPTQNAATRPVAAAPSASSADPGGRIVDADLVLVTGQQAGPGLWQVRRGANTLWILGTVWPLPKDVDWYSPQAEAVLARADEVLGRPGFSASVGTGGMFKLAFALPTLLKARRNPGDRQLSEVLPPDLYARWAALKREYLPRNDGVEKWRPTFAAGELYGAAIKRRGLSGGNVGERVNATIEKRKLKVTTTRVETKIKDPKGMARSFSRTPLDEVQCFRSVLDRLEGDVATAAERANAWAVGDMATLQRLAGRPSLQPCFDTFAQTDVARQMGMDDALRRSEAQWLAAAEAALARNDTTFAMLDLDQVLADDGLLARLRARGYEVIAPE